MITSNHEHWIGQRSRAVAMIFFESFQLFSRVQSVILVHQKPWAENLHHRTNDLFGNYLCGKNKPPECAWVFRFPEHTSGNNWPRSQSVRCATGKPWFWLSGLLRRDCAMRTPPTIQPLAPIYSTPLSLPVAESYRFSDPLSGFDLLRRKVRAERWMIGRMVHYAAVLCFFDHHHLCKTAGHWYCVVWKGRGHAFALGTLGPQLRGT